MGALPTGGDEGSIVSGNDVSVDARSADHLWTTSRSAVAAGLEPLLDSFRGGGGEQQDGGSYFGWGVSGDVAINGIEHVVEAYIRDTDFCHRRHGRGHRQRPAR